MCDNPVIATIQARHCKRSFLTTPVPHDRLDSILETASHAASSKNSQPWHVVIVSGSAITQLASQLCDKFDHDQTEPADYTYMTNPMPTLFKERARDCGYALFDLKQIDRHDPTARRAHARDNVVFFNAPVVLFFHLHPDAQPGNFLDLGLFMQNIMLALVSYNLASCPQFSLTRYTQTIKAYLDIDPKRILVCGLSLGYPDPNQPVNTFIPTRAPVSSFARWKTA